MAGQKIEKTGSVQVIDDTGTRHTITVFTTFLEDSDLSGERSWIPGLKSYKMSNGKHVNLLPDGSFQDIHTKRIMRPA